MGERGRGGGNFCHHSGKYPNSSEILPSEHHEKSALRKTLKKEEKK